MPNITVDFLLQYVGDFVKPYLVYLFAALVILFVSYAVSFLVGLQRD